MTIEWVPIEQLKPHPKNPNKHSPEQIGRLIELIKFQGWRHPIIAEEQTNIIHAGHGRWMAAREMGLLKVPVHFQTFDSPEQAYAFLVSDNTIASWAELDFSSINNDILELGPEFDLEMLGIQDFLLEPAEFEAGTENDQGQLDQKKLVFMECPHCGKQFEQQQARKIEA